MQELEKILEEISADTGYLEDWFINSVDDSEPVWTDKHIEELDEGFIVIPMESVQDYYIDDWIPVKDRMPTKEECEKNKAGYIKFLIVYGSPDNHSILYANCEWVAADNEDGSRGDFAEFWIDQFPQIFYPSLDLIMAWKIVEIPDPYIPEQLEGERR